MKPIKYAFIISLGLCFVCSAETSDNYKAKCDSLSFQYESDFAASKWAGQKEFISHPNLSMNYLKSIRTFFKNSITLDEARVWFQTNLIPVGYSVHNGSVAIDTKTGLKSARYHAFMQKLDSDTWLIFSFGGHLLVEKNDDYFNDARLVIKKDIPDTNNPAFYTTKRRIEYGVVK